MHTLFTLEDIYGIRIDRLFDEVCIRLDKGVSANYITMVEMFSSWQKQAEKLKNGEFQKRNMIISVTIILKNKNAYQYLQSLTICSNNIS